MLNALGAGYGCQLITVIQDLNQLKGLYGEGEWETYLANAGFNLFFSPRDWTTSDYISRMTGMKEVRSVSKTFNPETNVSSSVQGRRYMLPEEIRELAENEMVAFIGGLPGVIRAGRRPYYRTPDFFEADGQPKFDIDPYHVEWPDDQNERA